MHSRRTCGELLQRGTSQAGLVAIAHALGFAGDGAPLDATARRALGIPDDCRRASVVLGRGSLRALLLDVAGVRPLRSTLTSLAPRIAPHATPLLWLVCAKTRAGGGSLAIAACDVTMGRVRVRAMLCDPSQVTESDADTLAALAAADGLDDIATYARWLEVLGREAISRRFFLALSRHVALLAEGAHGPAPFDARQEVAVLYASRLLFLAFLEGKGWLNGSRAYLADSYAQCMLRGGRWHDRVLLPLFFGTLNTRPSKRAPAALALGNVPFLNGGLFSRAAVERRARTLRFPDDALGALLDEVLTRYRFTAREESVEWSEAAIDPEMLGRAFESLMELHTRHVSGAYYTPHALVVRVVEAALETALAEYADVQTVRALLARPCGLKAGAGAGAAAGAGGGGGGGASLRKLYERVAALRVLDPACGSGAFLVHALERLADLRATLGDPRPRDVLRRTVLTTAIFGVDVNPTAAWLCELRLWLSCVIDSPAAEPRDVAPLPNLDRNIRVGDALLGGGLETPADSVPRLGGMRALRVRYARASGRRKTTLALQLDREVRRHLIAATTRELLVLAERRRDVLMAARGGDLFGRRQGPDADQRRLLDTARERARELRSRLRALREGQALPFSFDTHFADIGAGGFDVVLGNPPWVRPHNVGSAMRDALRSRYSVLRDAAWRRGAALAGAKSGFAGQADLAAAFLERSLELGGDGCTVALLVPSKLWRSLAGGGIRRHLLERAALRVVEDWGDARAMFAAAVYPSLVIAQRGRSPNEVRAVVHRRDLAVRWSIPIKELSYDDTAGSPWLLLPPDAGAAFRRLERSGVPLALCGLGRITLGVKTGCNAAFLIADAAPDLEASLLRPVLRGEDVAAWRHEETALQLLWTHDRDGRARSDLPPRALRHLTRYRYLLERRSDLRAEKWWSLFRTEAARNDAPRVVWADLTRTPRACVLAAGDRTIPLNTCYVVRCRDERDAVTLAALLNSPLAAAWLGALAEPARGGYRRLLAWTMALLPVPDDWARARDTLGSLGELALRGRLVAAADLLEAACHAYRIRLSTVAPLCDWLHPPNLGQVT
ncbi:MAG: Eco57I restriction-modification methylase domain-containing protein [Gemmatimonadaceae bacterium]